MNVREVGVAHNVVVRIDCDIEAVAWLLDYLPSHDGFTRDLQAAWDSIMAEGAAQVAHPQGEAR